MELLIPGLILVALMVYLSTRIKRNAAAAYAPEIVETDEFRIEKADGFILPAEENERLPFAAYSREFGKDEADRLRVAMVELSQHRQTTIDDVRPRIASEVLNVSDERRLADGTVVLEGTASKQGADYETEVRLIERNSSVFELSAFALPEAADDHRRAVAAMLASFELK